MQTGDTVYGLYSYSIKSLQCVHVAAVYSCIFSLRACPGMVERHFQSFMCPSRSISSTQLPKDGSHLSNVDNMKYGTNKTHQYPAKPHHAATKPHHAAAVSGLLAGRKPVDHNEVSHGNLKKHKDLNFAENV